MKSFGEFPSDVPKEKPMFTGDIEIIKNIKVNGTTIIHTETGRFKIPTNARYNVIRSSEHYVVSHTDINTSYTLTYRGGTHDPITYDISRLEMQSLFEKGKIKVINN